MQTLLVAQLVVPVLLLALLLVAPPRSWMGLGVQLVASFLTLLAISRVGMWLFPPWWTPHVAVVGLVLTSAWRVMRDRPRRSWPACVLAWSALAAFSVAACGATVILWRAMAGAQPPADAAALSLEFPLTTGHYLVVNGGSALWINAHQKSRDTTIARLQPWRGNAYAVDLVAVSELGMRASGLLPRDPRSYHIFGMVVLAPCSGTVVRAVDGLPDMPVPQYDRANMAGNHVLLACEDVHVVLAHFQSNSVRVRVGDVVRAGDTLALVGNSGGTSEPHLHVHAQRPSTLDAPMAGDPVPMRLHERFLVRGDRVRIP
ncbi:MAG TPA: peptidoglycan DD-metalloendopeptidase family protein [Gemmatimonadaceae bacterium]|nr:peptidoglycan DD-metalloendopeptidase family protein [Gemmatimonadaceae bacterium]